MSFRNRLERYGKACYEYGTLIATAIALEELGLEKDSGKMLARATGMLPEIIGMEGTLNNEYETVAGCREDGVSQIIVQHPGDFADGLADAKP